MVERYLEEAKAALPLFFKNMPTGAEDKPEWQARLVRVYLSDVESQSGNRAAG
jgi:hypothetical protein